MPWVASVLKPPPPGAFYEKLEPTDVIASEWVLQTSDSGSHFGVSANMNNMIGKYGKGVYTVVIFSTGDGTNLQLTEISIFVR